MLNNKYYYQLNSKEKYYFQQIEYHSSEIPKMSINELAERIYTSPASLSRLVKKLGYNSYKEFKYSFVTNTRLPSNSSELKEHIDNLFETLPIIVDNCLIPAIEEANRIYIVSFGNSSGLGKELSLTLCSLNYTVFKIYDGDFLEEVYSNIRNDDIVIYISYKGNDDDMQRLAITLKPTHKQILFTSVSNSPLSSSVSLIINTHTSNLMLPFTTRLPLELLISITCMRLHKLPC